MKLIIKNKSIRNKLVGNIAKSMSGARLQKNLFQKLQSESLHINKKYNNNNNNNSSKNEASFR